MRGDGPGRLGRHRGGPGRAHQHRHAADLEVRHRGAEAALPGARDPRRADRRARASPSRARAPTWPRIATRAERVDGGWVLNGEKTYITNGVRAHFIVTAVKTTPRGRPPRHLLPDRRPRRGRQLRRRSHKLGWHASDTATISFQDVFVPEENLLGELNEGFKLIMANFQWERLAMALGAVGAMTIAWERTADVRARAPAPSGARCPGTRRSATSSPTSPPPCTPAAA